MVTGRASATINNLSGDVFYICYIDSKPVNMLSTLLCPMIDKVERYVTDKKSGPKKGTYQKLIFDQPDAIKVYNGQMGGVDLSDQMHAYYATSVLTIKWQPRFYFHFFDRMLVNGHILYNLKYSCSRNDPHSTLLEFRNSVLKKWGGLDEADTNEDSEEDEEVSSSLDNNHTVVVLEHSERQRCHVCASNHCKFFCLQCTINIRESLAAKGRPNNAKVVCFCLPTSTDPRELAQSCWVMHHNGTKK